MSIRVTAEVRGSPRPKASARVADDALVKPKLNGSLTDTADPLLKMATVWDRSSAVAAEVLGKAEAIWAGAARAAVDDGLRVTPRRVTEASMKVTVELLGNPILFRDASPKIAVELLRKATAR